MNNIKQFHYIFSILFFLSMFSPSYSQINEEDVYVKVDKMPRFLGCEAIVDEKEAYNCFGENLISFIKNEMKYPDLERMDNNEGVVYISFVVNNLGFIDNVEILRGASPLFDAEAVRVIKKIPPFKPGELDGKRVKVQYTLPISFKME